MSFTSLNYHVVFSTKDRRVLLDAERMERVCEYMGGIVENMGCRLHAVNGPGDHVHLAVSLGAQVSCADFVRTVKSNTSRWMHETFEDMGAFGWQDGYAAFTVSYSGLENVIAYIKGQVEHHRKMTFEEELTALLKKHKVDYDPRWLGG